MKKTFVFEQGKTKEKMNITVDGSEKAIEELIGMVERALFRKDFFLIRTIRHVGR